MAQSDRNIDRDLRAMRCDQLREEEDRATAERRFREMEDARRQMKNEDDKWRLKNKGRYWKKKIED